MSLPSQSPRVSPRGRTMMSRSRRKGPAPIAIAAVVGLCGLGLAYAVARPLLSGPSRADASQTADPGRLSTPPADSLTGAARNPVQPTGQPIGQPSGQPRATPSGTASPAPTPPPPVEISQESRRTTRPETTTDAAPSPAPAIQTPARPAATPAPSEAAASALRTAEAERAANRPLVAREVLLRALARPGLAENDRARLRDHIGRLNEEIIFSPRLHPGDPHTGEYVVQSGDSLSRIASRQGLAVDWRAIQRINAMASDTIRLGQRLKIIRGPFHAVVHKSHYRLDLYAGPPDSREEWVFIRSFPVGLGEGDGTPIGEFVVRRNSRLINPHWRNPRTGQVFDADDPNNPIGERWIGIRGLGEFAVIEGYGIHGTIEPDSIGRQRSMGCVRMLAHDVEVVYELLIEEISRVSIVP